jgi:hypothetical protein
LALVAALVIPGRDPVGDHNLRQVPAPAVVLIFPSPFQARRQA